MAIEFIRLELRKNRLIFIGLTAAFILSLPLMAMVWAKSRYPMSQGIDATLAFWTFLGLPGAALLFGGSSGSELRTEPADSAEGPLPLSPLGRVGGALSACGIHMVLLAVLVVLLSFSVSPVWRGAFLERSNSVPLAQPFFLLLAFTLVDLLILSFVAAYCLRSGILGGLIGALLGGLTTSFLVVGLALEIPFRERVGYVGLSLWPVAAALGGGLYAMYSASGVMERRFSSSRWRLIGIAAGLCVGTVLAYASLSRSFEKLFESMRLHDSRGERFRGEGLTDVAIFPAARKAAAQGALLLSLDGKLVWVTPSGSRTTLLPGERRSLGDFLTRPHWESGQSTAWGEDGRLWVMTRPDTTEYEIWSGPAQGPLALIRRNNDKHWLSSFARDGRKLGMLAWSNRAWHYAEMPSSGAPPIWKDIGADRGEFIARGREREGWAASLSEDRRALTLKPKEGRSVRWRLPGSTAAARQKQVLASWVGGKKMFLVPVRHGGGSALAVCVMDGVCSLEWKGGARESYVLSSNPDGSLWGRRDQGSLHVVTAEGKFLPPLRLASARDARVLRASGSRVWVLSNSGYLSMLDAGTGKPLEHWALSGKFDRRSELAPNFQAVEEGVFFRAGHQLYFIDWAGASRRLGAL